MFANGQTKGFRDDTVQAGEGATVQFYSGSRFAWTYNDDDPDLLQSATVTVSRKGVELGSVNFQVPFVFDDSIENEAYAAAFHIDYFVFV